jgi:HD-GYP domain-containing protein (c-di-GMP phosphodiesterase class II)
MPAAVGSLEHDPQLARRARKLSSILEVAKALVAEKDLDRLLELIVQEARSVVEADRVSLFLLDKDRNELWSKVAQGLTGQRREIRFPAGRGIVGECVSRGDVINIPDAYADARFNRDVDVQTGYRTRTILCVPMRDHRGDVVGALQALNKTDGAPFGEEDSELLNALGGQAAAAINNLLYQEEVQRLFEGFVQAAVVAIESRDPTTAGHSGRVARYSCGLALATERAGSTAGPWRDVRFSHDEIMELRYAALLHDFGKVGVREHVLVKADKLFPEEMEIVRHRFALIRRSMEAESARRKIEIIAQHGGAPGANAELRAEDERLQKAVAGLDGDLAFVSACNKPTVLAEGSFERLHEIARRTYRDADGEERPWLTGYEVNNLSIRRGSLAPDERKEIESHVTHTFRFLSQIPWTRALKRVPEIAYGHHEKLTGKGYPLGKAASDIPAQTRMMTISDIYDALTAADRPYKPAVPHERALDILRDEAKRGEVDGDLLRVFIEADVARTAPAI